MAIAFDAKSDGVENTATWSHTCTGSNLILIVMVAIRDTSSVSGITYAGAALAPAHRTTGNGMAAEIWYKTGPATGANNITVSGTFGNDYHGYAASFTGVEQTSPEDQNTGGTGTGANPTFNITPSQDGCVILGLVSHESGTAPTTGAGETALYNIDDGTWVSGCSYAIQTTATLQAINWTAGADSWDAIGVSFFAPQGPKPNVSDTTSITESIGMALVDNVVPHGGTGDAGVTPGWKKGIRIYTP